MECRIPVSESTRQLAEAIQALECSGDAEANIRNEFRVCAKLRTPLVSLTGKAGYRALLSRALALAKRDTPSLDDLTIDPEGMIRDGGHSPDERQDGEVRLAAHLLELLRTFLGEALMLRLVHDLWPDIAPGGSSTGKEHQ